jgi:hypothetical protein
MKWDQAHVDFRKPTQVWSSGGQWQPAKVLFIKDNYAVVKVKRYNGDWDIDGLDLEWYEKVGNRCKQLRNVPKKKFKYPKLPTMKIWIATWVMGRLF